MCIDAYISIYMYIYMNVGHLSQRKQRLGFVQLIYLSLSYSGRVQPFQASKALAKTSELNHGKS